MRRNLLILGGLGILATSLIIGVRAAASRIPIGFAAHPYSYANYADALSRGFTFFRGDITNPQNVFNYPNGPFMPGWVTKAMVANQISEYNQVKAAGARQIGLFGPEAVAYYAYQTAGITNWGLNELESCTAATLEVFPDIHIWEFGNEVNWLYNGFPGLNLLGYFDPSAPLGPSANQAAIPANYVQCLAQFYSQVKSTPGHANDIILGGGTLSVVSVDDCSTQFPYGFGTMRSIPSYAQQIAAAGAQNYMDGLGIHLYSEAVYLLSERPTNSSTLYQTPYTVGDIFSYALNLHANLYKGTPIYITESGIISSYPGSRTSFVYPSWLPQPTVSRQALYGAQLINWLNSQPAPIAGFMWYDLVDGSPVTNCLPANFSEKGDLGAYYCSTNNPKPVVRSLQP